MVKDSSGYYHQACFTCSLCKASIENGFIRKENGKIYHPECSGSVTYQASALTKPTLKTKISEILKPSKKTQQKGTEDIGKFPINKAAELSLSAMKQFSIVLGVIKTHVSEELEEYVSLLMSEGSQSRKNVVEHLKKGIRKVKKELYQSAKEEFEKIADWENTETNKEASIISRCKLFAQVLVVSYTEQYQNQGPCFKPLEHLSIEEKKLISMHIDHMIEMEKNANNDKFKQLTYNLRSVYDDAMVLHNEIKIEATINYGRLPSCETYAACLHISRDEASSAANLFLWVNSSFLFIRSKLALFSIPLVQIENNNNETTVNIRLENREKQGLVCNFGKETYERTADRKNRLPDNLLPIGTLLDSLKKSLGATKILPALGDLFPGKNICF